MTVLFKIPPPPAESEELLAVSAKGYGKVTLSPGDRAFLWWSETQGGTGLAAQGVVVEAHNNGAEWDAKIAVSSRTKKTLGKDDLRTYRDVASAEPRATLSRKLYKHSLNKVTAVDKAEEDFLDSYF